jgi:hypothetical protein
MHRLSGGRAPNADRFRGRTMNRRLYISHPNHTAFNTSGPHLPNAAFHLLTNPNASLVSRIVKHTRLGNNVTPAPPRSVIASGSCVNVSPVAPDFPCESSGYGNPPRCRIRCGGGRADANSLRGRFHSFRRAVCCPARLQGPREGLGTHNEVLGAQGRVTHPLDDVIVSKNRFFALGVAFFADKNANKRFLQRSFLSTPHPSVYSTMKII